MAIIVQKYGGSSVADVDKIKAIAEKIVATKREGHDVVVVVSAMGNTTDDLLRLAAQINSSPERRELDMLLSVGERISMALLSMAIQTHGIGAISFTGSQSGIITTASHYEARVVEVRPYRIQDELEAGKVVIVAGYQGVSYKREITTLGRGGSDTTAVALAAALGAEACEIYSDVDGIFSGDPRVIDSAAKLEEIQYEEMQELARHGAKVLNSTAVEFARRAQIALYARTAHGSGTGTSIHGGGGFKRVDGFEEQAHRAATETGVRSVTGLRRGLLLTLTEAQPKAIDAILELAETLETPFLRVDPCRGDVQLLVNIDNLHDLSALKLRLRERGGPSLVLTEDIGLAAVVGNNVGARPMVARLLLQALAAEGIRPISVGASGPSVACLLACGEVNPAMRILHAAFIA
jgi:aspartate kinase